MSNKAETAKFDPRVAFNRATGADQVLASKDVFGINMVDAPTGDILAWLLDYDAKRRVSIADASVTKLAASDEGFAEALAGADLVLPEGATLKYSARIAGWGLEHPHTINEFFPELCQAAAKRGYSIYLLGGDAGAAEATAFTARRFAPGLKIAGVRDNGFDVDDCDGVISAINASGADIVLVSMNAPDREAWMAENSQRIGASLLMGVNDLFAEYASNSGSILSAIPKAAKKMSKIAGYSASAAWIRLKRYETAKRALDITASSCGLIVLSPLFVGMAIAIRAESKGGVFFKQYRVGKNGELFPMMKFRSMFADAEARREALLADSERKGVCFKMKDDPRVTKIGKFIRRSSIDELPQLINVLKGEMSLVGPRPALTQEVEQYDDRDLARLATVPGITGIWQISGRADISFKRMIEMDIAYSKSRSILLDIAVLLLTAPALLSSRGAY
jgi:exopolysaccharide biosynthesis WecB/TagA/CpsF family protein